jgi:hypothetical protein
MAAFVYILCERAMYSKKTTDHDGRYWYCVHASGRSWEGCRGRGRGPTRGTDRCSAPVLMSRVADRGVGGKSTSGGPRGRRVNQASKHGLPSRSPPRRVCPGKATNEQVPHECQLTLVVGLEWDTGPSTRREGDATVSIRPCPNVSMRTDP